MAERVSLPPTSRYKNTPLLRDADGAIFFDLWVEPSEVAGDQDATTRHSFNDAEVGRLDSVSHQHFQSVFAWWAIAAKNGIRDQVEDMNPENLMDPEDRDLIIPRRVAVQNFLAS